MTLEQLSDTSLTSWVNVQPNSDFPIQNLPFGIFSTAGSPARVGVAIGEYILDISFLYEHGYLDNLPLQKNVFAESTLNSFFRLGKSICREVRLRIGELLSAENTELRDNPSDRAMCLIPADNATLHLPVSIPNYTDFYSSIEHATNVGMMFRDPENPLLPNWKHIPVGYHGRASSIVVSGTPIRRPLGQVQKKDGEAPIFMPSALLDFELETAFIICKENSLGEPIPMSEAEDYIIGMVLFNDWSARDIQRWEYVPLGPFLGKNFGSSLSPWVVMLDALEQCRVAGPVQEPEPLPYLQYTGNKNYNIALDVILQAPDGTETVICRSNFKYMYWNMCQQLVHHASNGCNMQIGDLLASGTISGPTPDSYGSMLELSWRGTKPLTLSNGEQRSFLRDGDTVIMRGTAVGASGINIGFGEVRSTILPAPENYPLSK